MLTYFLTLLCAASILLAAFFAIRYRKVNAYIRMAALALSAIFVLYLWFKYDETTQLWGLAILAVAFLFPLVDSKTKKGTPPKGEQGGGYAKEQ